jgi:hypothetical protein
VKHDGLGQGPRPIPGEDRERQRNR